MKQSEKKIFIYLDNFNIFISAQHVAAERESGNAFYRVRIAFKNLVYLARAERAVGRAIAVGSIPPELRLVWNRLEQEGLKVQLLERGAQSSSEQGVDQILQTCMLRDLADYNGTPGIVVLLTGDGSGFYNGVGFHADIERMHRRGWGIEVLAWRYSCNPRMREWVQQNGLFIALDDFYDSITYLEPALPGTPIAPPRDATLPNLSARKT